MRRLPTLLLLFALSAIAQNPAPQNTVPAFEVASIRVHPPDAPGRVGFHSIAGGRVELGYASLTMLVSSALNIDTQYISGAPDWSSKVAYDITATPPEDSPSRKLNLAGYTATPTTEQRAMILSLLKERFGLRYHTETSDKPVYFLERGKGPLKLNPAAHPERAADPRCNVGDPTGWSFGYQITLGVLAEKLSRVMGRPLIDRTGIAGVYDFMLDRIDPENKDQQEGGLLVTKALGLSLVNGRAPVRTVVIDRANPPTPN